MIEFAPLGATVADGGLAPIRAIGHWAWRGDWAGRTWELRIRRISRTIHAGEIERRQVLGYQLTIEASTHVQARVYFVDAKWAAKPLMRRIYRWRRYEVVEDLPDALAGFCAVAHEGAWARRLADDPALAAAISTLLQERAGAASPPSVFFEPGSIHFNTPPINARQLTPAMAQASLLRLADIAGRAERLPPPVVPAQLTRFGAFARGRPMVVAFAILGVLMFATLVITVTLIGLAFLFSRI